MIAFFFIFEMSLFASNLEEDEKFNSNNNNNNNNNNFITYNAQTRTYMIKSIPYVFWLLYLPIRE